MAFSSRLARIKPYLNHRQFCAIAKPDAEANKQKIRTALSHLEANTKRKTISSAEQILYLSLSDAVSTFPHSSDFIPSFLLELKTQPSLLCSLLDELKSRPDLQKDQFFSKFITLYAEAGMFDRALQTFKDMDAMEINSPTQSFNMLLRAAGLYKNNASEVLELFNELSDIHDITPDIETYNILLKGFVPLGYYAHRESICSLLRKLEDERFHPDVATTNIIMDGLQKENLEDAAQVILDMAEREILSLHAQVYNFGVQSLCKLKKTSEAQKLFDVLSHIDGILQDVETYNCLLEEYVPLGYYNHRETICSLLEHMDNEGCTPDDTTWNTVMVGLWKETLEDAAKVIQAMVDRDVELLDERVYNYGIQSLCKLKKTSEALKLFKTVTLQDEEPNADYYERVIKLCSKEGKLEEFIKIHRDMRRHMDSGTYRSCCETLVEILCKYKLYETAYMAVKECISEKWFADAFLPDNRSIIKSLMCGLVRTSKHDMIKKLVELMEENVLKADLEVYTLGMECLPAVEAKAVFEGLRAKDLKLDDRAYMHLINSFGKEGNVEEVVKLYHEMQEEEKKEIMEPYRNCYETILKFLIRHGETDMALQVCKHCMAKEWFGDFFFSSDMDIRKSLFSLVTSNARVQKGTPEGASPQMLN